MTNDFLIKEVVAILAQAVDLVGAADAKVVAWIERPTADYASFEVLAGGKVVDCTIRKQRKHDLDSDAIHF